jgi:long-chain-acyl-CoA dehydrogenase
MRLPFTESHEIFRATARRFFEAECVPQQRVWEKDAIAPRSIWTRASELGFLCPRVDETYGGLGADFLYSIILVEEQARAGVVAPQLSQHSDVVSSYIANYGTEEQKAAFLPRMASGAMLGALAIADGARGTVAQRDGSSYFVNGQKRFVLGGYSADVIVVAAKTGAGVSLFIVETAKAEGLETSKKLKKLGQAATDCVDLRFDDMRVSPSALLGGRSGEGAAQIAGRLAEERLLAAAASIAIIDRALAITTEYVKDRKAFKQRIIDFQNTRFRLAEAKTEAVVLRVFLERCVGDFLAGRLAASDAAVLAYSAADRQCAIVDDCVQLHGGYGYILDYAIARAWTDGRLNKILQCTDEAQRDIVNEGAGAP